MTSAMVAPSGHDPDVELVRAYLDLSTYHGPIHARSMADMGRRLADGRPMQAYQINTPSLFRSLLGSRRTATVTVEDRDPRDLPSADWSGNWRHLCEMLDDWHSQALGDQVSVAAVLNKLGYWQLLLDLLPGDLNPTQSAAHAKLRQIRCNAAVKSLGGTSAVEDARVVQTAVAKTASFDPLVRLFAAVSLVVHHARVDASKPEIARWAALAKSIADPEADRIGPLQRSIYLRGISFEPFLNGDHATVASMLDEAESCAREAVLVAAADELLLAEENLHPLLETRASAARARGDLDLAERYYRDLVDHDCWDGKVHIRLGDFLLRQGRVEEARRSYQTAAMAGVPHAGYAYTQIARCSGRLGDEELAAASLVTAHLSDPGAITPLAMLRARLPATGLTALSSWVDHELHLRLEQGRRTRDVGGTNRSGRG